MASQFASILCGKILIEGGLFTDDFLYSVFYNIYKAFILILIIIIVNFVIVYQSLSFISILSDAIFKQCAYISIHEILSKPPKFQSDPSSNYFQNGRLKINTFN